MLGFLCTSHTHSQLVLLEMGINKPASRSNADITSCSSASFCPSHHRRRQQSSTEWMLPKDERRSACGTTLLRIGVGEQAAFFGNSIDVGRLVTHDAMVVRTDIVNPNVVPPKDNDVRLFS
jgi:hypothetical protein